MPMASRAAVVAAVAVFLLLLHRLPVLHGQSSGFFSTNQSADLLLSGYGFNRTGGALRFNHPAGIAVVSGNLVLADRNNNRVLIWSGVPASADTAPVRVLGQSSFDTNAPGTGLDNLNWPTAVATDGTRLYVADTYNHRVLVWLSLPTSNKQPASFALTTASGVSWPWGIWTNGQKLAVSATDIGRVLIWNSPPTSDVAPALTLQISDFGTPRTIESDGTRFLVSDHNAVNNSREPGNFFWSSFPTTATHAYSFFLARPPITGASTTGPSEHMHDGEILSDGRLLGLFGRTLCIWSSFPASASETCAVALQTSGSLVYDAGDNSGLAISNGRLFVSLNNGNRVLAYPSVPTSSSALPDFAIGSPSVTTNPLETDFIVTNPVPHSDGQRLWVVSGYDKRMHVWFNVPSQSGQAPDYTYQFEYMPLGISRYGDGIVIAGQETVMFWNSPPTGQAPDVTMQKTVGGQRLNNLRGVAYDGTYFALASYTDDRVWVWRGVPGASTSPLATITVDEPGRIALDGRYLAVSFGGPSSGIQLYDLALLAAGTITPVTVGASLQINLPQGVTLAGGGLFVPDTNNNRVLAWRDAAAAYAGGTPDAVLGATDLTPVRRPSIGQNTLFWPAAVAYDGNRLWVGEYKFSNRLLRFSRDGANTPPTISDIANGSVAEDGQLGATAFTVGDAETAAASLTLSAASSNSTLVPASAIVFGGSGAARTLSITPAANASGTATLTVTVSDGSVSTSDSFVLTVTAVNDAPTISAVTAQSGAAGRAIGPLAVTVSDIDTGLASLTLTAASSNSAVVSPSAISFGGADASRTVSLQSSAEAGTTSITLSVSDGAASASTSFNVSSTHSSPLTFTAEADGSLVTFSWGAPASTGEISTYRVQIGAAAGATDASLDTGTTRGVSATTLASGTWFARVRAWNTVGESPPSNEVSFVLSGAPSRPRNFTASVNGNTVALSWDAPAAGTPDGYELEAGSAASLSNVAVVPLRSSPRAFTAVAPNGTYFTRVKALNRAGRSSGSNEVSFTVGPATLLPGAPRQLQATAAGATVMLSWDVPVSGGSVTGYLIEAGSRTGSSNLALVPVAATSFTAHAVPIGSYFVRVRGWNALGSGPPSNEVSFTIGTPLRPPGAPNALTFAVAGSSVTLTWSAPSTGDPPQSYIIQAGSSPGASNLASIAIGVTPSFTAHGVPRGTYYVRVVAANAGGVSSPSNEVRVVAP